MKEPRPGAWHGGLWFRFRNGGIEWNQVVYQIVPVAFKTCETSGVLDRCSGVGPLDLSKSP